MGTAILGHAAFIPGWVGDRAGANDRLSAARSHARRAGASGLLWAWLDAVEAECATRSGDFAEALRLISRAESHLRDESTSPRPPWLDWFSPARLAAFRGYVELKAGHARRAKKSLTTALDGSGHDENKQRAVILADLAAAELADDNLHACCDYLDRALDELRQQWYATAMDRITEVRRALRPWQDDTRVRQLDHRLYGWSAALTVLRS